MLKCSVKSALKQRKISSGKPFIKNFCRIFWDSVFLSFQIYHRFKSKTNCIGVYVGTPFAFGVGGPIVREHCISIVWDPLGVGGPAGHELCSYCIGYGINPILPKYMLCQGLINIWKFYATSLVIQTLPTAQR